MAGYSSTGNGAVQHCSREDSRQARQIITQAIYPFFAGEDPSIMMHEDCPLNASLDMFLDQELNKSIVPGKRDQFKCAYCGKQFQTEIYMDRHMDNKHVDKIKFERDGSGHCLGSLCGELGCGAHRYKACDHKTLLATRGAGEWRDGWAGVAACEICHPTEMERRQSKCMKLFRRCFDPSGAVAARGEETARLRDFFVHQFCDHLACGENHYPLPPPPGQRGGPNANKPWFDNAHGTGTTSKFGVIVFLVLILAVFYAGVWIRHRSTSTKRDLYPMCRDATVRARLSRGIAGVLRAPLNPVRGFGGNAAYGRYPGETEVLKRSTRGDGEMTVVHRRRAKLPQG